MRMFIHYDKDRTRMEALSDAASIYTYLQANSDDEDLCAWISEAKCGDRFTDGGACADFTLERIQ